MRRLRRRAAGHVRRGLSRSSAPAPGNSRARTTPAAAGRRPPILVPLAPRWWSLTPYEGCAHRCVYCSAAAQGLSRPKETIARLPARLREELQQVAARDAITVGALADAYPPVELKRGLTRACLVELVAQRRGFTIVTKGNAVLRDVDLLARHRRRCTVFVSLSTLDERIARRIEPGAPSPRERVDLVHRLRDSGVRVGVSAAPWIPGVTDTRQLLAQLPPIPVQFAALHALWVRGRAHGLTFSQDEVNRAYLDAFARTPRRTRVTWLAPPEPGVLQMNCLRFL